MGGVNIGPWDGVLIAGVALQATVLAFVREPRWKALLYSFPIPFTIANLALGRPVGTSHMLGFLNLLLFINLVRWLRQDVKAPIVAAITASAVAYCAVGALLNAVVPRTGPTFWAAFAVVIAAGVVFGLTVPYRAEPGYRSELPVAVKFLVIAAVISVLVILKNVLGGFMATFPMVGVVATYEARHSLWTMTRQVPVVILGLGPMAAAMWVVQAAGAGIPLSLAAGWVAWLVILIPITLYRWRKESKDRGAIPVPGVKGLGPPG